MEGGGSREDQCQDEVEETGVSREETELDKEVESDVQ